MYHDWNRPQLIRFVQPSSGEYYPGSEFRAFWAWSHFMVRIGVSLCIAAVMSLEWLNEAIFMYEPTEILKYHPTCWDPEIIYLRISTNRTRPPPSNYRILLYLWKKLFPGNRRMYMEPIAHTHCTSDSLTSNAFTKRRPHQALHAADSRSVRRLCGVGTLGTRGNSFISDMGTSRIQATVTKPCIVRPSG